MLACVCRPVNSGLPKPPTTMAPQSRSSSTVVVTSEPRGTARVGGAGGGGVCNGDGPATGSSSKVTLIYIIHFHSEFVIDWFIIYRMDRSQGQACELFWLLSKGCRLYWPLVQIGGHMEIETKSFIIRGWHTRLGPSQEATLTGKLSMFLESSFALRITIDSSCIYWQNTNSRG